MSRRRGESSSSSSLLHQQSDARHGRHSGELVEAQFATACQVLRTNKEVCRYGCGKLLAPRTIDYHRLNGCRGKAEDAFADLSRRRNFVCGACFDEFINRETFFAHLSNEHCVDATSHSLAFPDYATFDRFRHWLESQSGAHFRQKSGAKSRPSGKGFFMMCNRSGLVHTSATTGEPDRDKVGNFRVGFTCTAYINGTQHPDGHVTIRFCGDHYGHDWRMRLPLCVKNLMMHHQAQGLTNTAIIRILQHHFMPLAYESILAHRVALVNHEEIRSLTPVLKKMAAIPYDKEEEWEEEFLEMAGIHRDYVTPRPRPVGWMPIKELAEEMEWPQPISFEPKMRNSRGEWIVVNHCRASAIECMMPFSASRTTIPRSPAVPGGMYSTVRSEDVGDDDEEEEELVEEDEEDRRRREEEEEEAAEEGEEQEVDVEEVREEHRRKRRMKSEEARPPSSAAASAAAAAAAARYPKKSQLQTESVRSGGREQRKVVEEVEEEEELVAEEPARVDRSAYLVSTLMTELDMIKALVKTDAEFLTESDLMGYLEKTRALRLSMEPMPRHVNTSIIGQRDCPLPQLSRPNKGMSRPAAAAARKRRTQAAQFGGYGAQPAWGDVEGSPVVKRSVRHLTGSHQQEQQQQLLQLQREEAASAIEMDAEEEMMGEAGGEDAPVRRINYNSKLWM